VHDVPLIISCTWVLTQLDWDQLVQQVRCCYERVAELCLLNFVDQVACAVHDAARNLSFSWVLTQLLPLLLSCCGRVRPCCIWHVLDIPLQGKCCSC
jgi:hypothetical protein